MLSTRHGLAAASSAPATDPAIRLVLSRENLEVRYAEVLGALVRACQAQEDHMAATQAARRLVELDPLNEAAQRDLMISYARSGRRSHALRQYLESRRALIDGVGIEPALETTELQRRILVGEPV